jgi:MoaA/NifB/PqqE/SkfB family radical SAM enzyme
VLGLNILKTKKLITLNRNTSPTICPLPFMSFYGTAKGTVVSCCEAQETQMSDVPTSMNFFNNEHYERLRRELLAGEKPALCKKCWKNEDVGLKSNRIQAWEDVERGIFGTRALQTSPSGEVEDFPSFLELKCSNVCNLKCRMCHPESSHRVIEDRDIIDHYRKGLPWSEKPLRPVQLFDQLKSLTDKQASAVRVLQYSGGEPLISREQFELTSRFADKYGHQIQLRYSTNLNNLTFEKYDVLTLWKKFKQVHVKVSADGIGDTYNYVRVGGNFDLLVENLHRLIDAQIPGLELAVGFTTQSYNVFQLPETVDFFSKIVGKDHITSYLLYTPSIMCIENMPDLIKKRVIQKLKNSSYDFSDKISFLENSQDTEVTRQRWGQFLKYTDEMERKYNITQGYQFLLEKYLPQ